MSEQQERSHQDFCEHENEPGSCDLCQERPIVKPQRLQEGIRRTLHSAPEGTPLAEHLADKFTDALSKYMPDMPDQVSGLREKLAAIPDDTDPGTLTAAAAEIVNTFLAEHFTPESFEEISRQGFIEQSKTIPLNEILTYGVYKEIAHIHLAPAETMGPKLLITKVKEGLAELATRLESDPDLADVKKITATSWIVAKNPHLLERMGFSIDGPISDEVREQRYRNDDREISTSHMNREDFLARYL